METRQKQQWYRRIFIVLVLIFVFQNPLQEIFTPMRYWDELFAACIIPLLIMSGTKQNFRCKVSLKLILVIIFLCLFLACGLYGNLSLKFQPLTTVLSDMYLNLKFFLAIGVGYLFFSDVDMESIYQYSWRWIKRLSIFLFVLCLLDLVFHIFPADTRLGLRAVRLFYSVYTYLAAACIFLCSILLRLYEYYRDEILPYLIMLGFVTICTLRIKAIGAMICLFFIYFIICKKRREFRFFTWAVLLVSMLLVAERQFNYYFLSLGTESARAALTKVSFLIAKDYFPFGTGFGTFASTFSDEPYSRVYSLYHIQNVWGISKSYSSFVSDTFWPMILGQTGYLGTICYAVVLVILLSVVFKLRKYNAYLFASALTMILYLLISSTSESAFVNTMAVPFAFLIGVHLAEIKKYSVNMEETIYEP